MTTGKIERWTFITRAAVRRHPDKIFVFGDNMARSGYGGQAREMRGEPNTIGIPTKHSPSREERAYFTDADWNGGGLVLHEIIKALDMIRSALAEGRNVVIPSDGVGTGLAQLEQRAPLIAKIIDDAIAGFSEGTES